MEGNYEEQARKYQEFKDRVMKSEAHLESYFTRKVKEAGGWAIKFNSIGTNGLPDRIVFFSGFTWLVELKTPKGTVQPVQKMIHTRFKTYGHNVRIIRTKEQVSEFIDDMLNLIF